MSYEGYSVFYCKNGHRLGVRDAYDYEDSPPKCVICGSSETIIDMVDETNGCECQGEGSCAAHEKITDKDIIKYDPIVCSKCNGLGYIYSKNYMTTYCCNEPTCSKCYGTGKEYSLIENYSSIEPCVDCCGRGKKFVAVYNLSRIMKNGA